MCVGYIDFGNSEEVLLNQLRPISMSLLSLATQAIPCALAGKAKMFLTDPFDFVGDALVSIQINKSSVLLTAV